MPFISEFQAVMGDSGHRPVVGAKNSLVVVGEDLPAEFGGETFSPIDLCPSFEYVQGGGFRSPCPAVLTGKAGFHYRRAFLVQQLIVCRQSDPAKNKGGKIFFAVGGVGVISADTQLSSFHKITVQRKLMGLGHGNGLAEAKRQKQSPYLVIYDCTHTTNIEIIS